MKFIIIEISIIILGIICFFASNSILDLFDSNVIQIEYNNQSSYKLNGGKYYLYNTDVQYTPEDHLQSENGGVITSDYESSNVSQGGIYRGEISVSTNSEIINLTPELKSNLKNRMLNVYLFATFSIENELDYDISFIYTNISDGQSTYTPSFALTSTNPKITNTFDWIHDNIAFVTIAAVFTCGMIFVNLPDKKRN